jgi:hypothetical protein
MCVFGKDRKFIVLVEHPNRARLLLREQEATVFSADDAIRVVWALPYKFPFGARGNDARDCRDGYFLLGARLREITCAAAPGISLLRRGDPAHNDSQCNKTTSDPVSEFNFHNVSKWFGGVYPENPVLASAMGLDLESPIADLEYRSARAMFDFQLIIAIADVCSKSAAGDCKSKIRTTGPARMTTPSAPF